MSGRFTGILLLFCLVVPMGVTLLVLQHQKNLIRKEVKEKLIAEIDKEELVLLKFALGDAETQISWKHSKEFEFRGQMYDVVEKQTLRDTVYYWCWWDHRETRLNKQLEKLVSGMLGTDPEKKENQEKVFEFYKKIYCSIPSEIKVFTDQSLKKFHFSIEDYLSLFTAPPTPPPRMG